MSNHFTGDTPHLVRCINALLELDAAGALKPHGIGGHARTLLEASARALLGPEAPYCAKLAARCPDVCATVQLTGCGGGTAGDCWRVKSG